MSTIVLKDIQPRVVPRSDHYYLKYVTVGRALQETKTILLLWLFFGPVGVAVAYAAGWGLAGTIDRSPLGAVPNRFWLWVGVLILVWVLRGKTFTLPNLTLTGWLAMILGPGTLTFASPLLPFWALWLISESVFALWFLYDSLVGIGKTNYAEGVIPRQIVDLAVGHSRNGEEHIRASHTTIWSVGRAVGPIQR